MSIVVAPDTNRAMTTGMGIVGKEGFTSVCVIWDRLDFLCIDRVIEGGHIHKFGLIILLHIAHSSNTHSPGRTQHINVDDGKAVKRICRAILLRAARLSACALAATLILMGRAALSGRVVRGGGIYISGRCVMTTCQWLSFWSLTRLTEPAFQYNMEEALREIIGADATIWQRPCWLWR